jgi:hypothetical protein
LKDKKENYSTNTSKLIRIMIAELKIKIRNLRKETYTYLVYKLCYIAFEVIINVLIIFQNHVFDKLNRDLKKIINILD